MARRNDFETETVDKLFLELEQISNAQTPRELNLATLLRRAYHEFPLVRNRSTRCKILSDEIAQALVPYFGEKWKEEGS